MIELLVWEMPVFNIVEPLTLKQRSVTDRSESLYVHVVSQQII